MWLENGEKLYLVIFGLHVWQYWRPYNISIDCISNMLQLTMGRSDQQKKKMTRSFEIYLGVKQGRRMVSNYVYILTSNSPQSFFICIIFFQQILKMEMKRNFRKPCALCPLNNRCCAQCICTSVQWGVLLGVSLMFLEIVKTIVSFLMHFSMLQWSWEHCFWWTIKPQFGSFSN